MLSSCKNALGTVPPLRPIPACLGIKKPRPRRGCGGTEVFPVARPRRLRYKLMLGLGLVVGSVVLLVGGTLYGIRAYNATVKTTERKMVELALHESTGRDAQGARTDRSDCQRRFRPSGTSRSGSSAKPMPRRSRTAWTRTTGDKRRADRPARCRTQEAAGGDRTGTRQDRFWRR